MAKAKAGSQEGKEAESSIQMKKGAEAKLSSRENQERPYQITIRTIHRLNGN